MNGTKKITQTCLHQCQRFQVLECLGRKAQFPSIERCKLKKSTNFFFLKIMQFSTENLPQQTARLECYQSQSVCAEFFFLGGGLLVTICVIYIRHYCRFSVQRDENLLLNKYPCPICALYHHHHHHAIEICCVNVETKRV